ncbi:MAG: lysine biosynthesis protein LysX [Halobacteria archaeon]
MKVGVLYSRVRKDEKLLLNELRGRGHEVRKINTRDLSLPPNPRDAEGVEDVGELDVVLDRAMSYSRGLYTSRFFESYGVEVINGHRVAEVCGNKVETSLALTEHGVDTPEFRVAYEREKAVEAAEEMGYPVVVKPVVGSWARLLAKVNDREAAKAVFEHKDVLGHYEHSVFYVQDYVDKPGRDVRAMVADGEVVAAMYRYNDDWVTNAAQGGEVENCEVDSELEETAVSAAEAVGGGILGVDLMEGEDGYTVHEVNHKLEFKALNEASDVDIAAKYVDYAENRVKRGVTY